MSRIDASGIKINRLTFIKDIGGNNNGRIWLCECLCGNRIKAVYAVVKSGGIKSCGCLSKESMSRFKKVHGLSKSTFYIKYQGIHRRCEDKKNDRYKYYGGKGIKCLWNSFDAYKKDMYESYLEHVKAHGVKNTTID